MLLFVSSLFFFTSDIWILSFGSLRTRQVLTQILTQIWMRSMPPRNKNCLKNFLQNQKNFIRRSSTWRLLFWVWWQNVSIFFQLGRPKKDFFPPSSSADVFWFFLAQLGKLTPTLTPSPTPTRACQVSQQPSVRKHYGQILTQLQLPPVTINKKRFWYFFFLDEFFSSQFQLRSEIFH